MTVEKHNAHGMQLVVSLSQEEALSMIEKLSKTFQGVTKTGVNHYAEFHCAFEDDNDQWVTTNFDVVVKGHPVLDKDCVKV